MVVTPHVQSWLVPQSSVYGMKLPTRFQLIGQVGLSEYTKWIKWFQESHSVSTEQAEPITFRTYARSADIVAAKCLVA